MKAVKKILLITDGISPYVLGGMQRHSANLAKYLTMAGIDVTLVHCVGDQQNVPSEDEVNEELFGKTSYRLNDVIGLKFPNAGKLPGHYLKESYQYSDLVYDRLKEELNDYDFIYAKGFTAWKLIEMKRKGSNIPPIGVKFHGYEMFQKPPSFKASFERILLRSPVKWNTLNADYVFSYGAKITDLIKKLGVSDGKIISVPSGIDSEWVRTESLTVNSPVRFVFLGRYERRKGIEELMEAIKSLSDDLKYEFHFIGPIPENKQLSSPKMFYHGAIREKDKLVDLLDSFDVLVCPSHSEGMPNVILEGMARGLAIIATDVGAVRLLVSDKLGHMMEKVDVSELKETLVRFANMNSNDLEAMKKISLETVDKGFRWEIIVQQLIDKIEKVVGKTH